MNKGGHCANPDISTRLPDQKVPRYNLQQQQQNKQTTGGKMFRILMNYSNSGRFKRGRSKVMLDGDRGQRR